MTENARFVNRDIRAWEYITKYAACHKYNFPRPDDLFSTNTSFPYCSLSVATLNNTLSARPCDPMTRYCLKTWTI